MVSPDRQGTTYRVSQPSDRESNDMAVSHGLLMDINGNIGNKPRVMNGCYNVYENCGEFSGPIWSFREN